MFAARCAGISLALFILLYVPLSLLVSRGWSLVLRWVSPQSARRSANLLFSLRILPFVTALLFTLMFTLPSFLLLEPRATDEAVGTLPVILGFCCLAVLMAGIIKAVSVQIRTSRALMKWLEGSIAMEPGAAIPVFRTGNDSPTFTVAGVREPKVLVSEAAIAALSHDELRAALKHEMAHVRSYDNLKKLCCRFFAFPGMTSLERAWSEQTELAADDAAVSCKGDALDLASALIKVSRLAPASPKPVLTTGLLHSSTALSVRVQRLFSWEERPVHQEEWSTWYALPPAFAACVIVAAIYDSALAQLHTLTEWLVR